MVLTIGIFDAVHLGHQALLKTAREIADKQQGRLMVMTFINHPVEVLRPGSTVSKLCTLDHRLALLEKQGVDGVILLEFTRQFAGQTAEEFISAVFSKLFFQALVLGHDARVGVDRQGDSPFMRQLAARLGYLLQFVPPHQHGATIISSSLIRQAVSRGDLAEAQRLLGRKFSIVSTLSPDFGAYRVDVLGLCLPPPGEYPVLVGTAFGVYPAYAFIEFNKGQSILILKFNVPHLRIIDQNCEVLF